MCETDGIVDVNTEKKEPKPGIRVDVGLTLRASEHKRLYFPCKNILYLEQDEAKVTLTLTNGATASVAFSEPAKATGWMDESIAILSTYNLIRDCVAIRH